MLGNLHVRFGERGGEPSLFIGVWRFIPTHLAVLKPPHAASYAPLKEPRAADGSCFSSTGNLERSVREEARGKFSLNRTRKAPACASERGRIGSAARKER